jgi:hypothetical protein
MAINGKGAMPWANNNCRSAGLLCLGVEAGHGLPSDHTQPAGNAVAPRGSLSQLFAAVALVVDKRTNVTNADLSRNETLHRPQAEKHERRHE